MSHTGRHIFPADNRIKKRQDFLAVRNRGLRFRTDHFFIHVLATGNKESRLGITVSRKIGNAVVRNRVKRLVREFYRLNADTLPTGADISIVARRQVNDFGLADVTDELKILRGLTLDQEDHD